MRKQNLGLVVMIAGPTGVGESTITGALLKNFPNARRLVTATSRPKRPGEINGRDYFFVSKKTFEKQIKDKKFLEYTYVKNRDHYYGSKKSELEKILRSGKMAFFNCDKIGLNAIKKTYPKNNLSIFIGYNKLSDIKKHLVHRNPNLTQSELKIRLTNAREENQDKRFYDRVIINRHGQIEKTVARALRLIQKHLINISPNKNPRN
jgi:guanylate kinase